jgi:Ca2+-dependent lipid-binding protein|mmetsp:Transcript_8269/g.25864  ORF Transcript_8269/g.25864 Transcript_8269/m.25864 type:complete len:269 (+) Transcript_8269:87-893(+)
MSDIKVKIKKCVHLEGSSLLPGGSSDPYVIVKLCEGDKVEDKKQTKTVNNNVNPEYDEKFKFKDIDHPARHKLKFEIWDSDIGRDDKLGHGHFHLGECEKTSEEQNFSVVVDGGYFVDAKIKFSITTDGSWGNPVDAKGTLLVNILKCEGLDDADYAGTTDPYAWVKVGGCDDTQQTEKQENTLNPEWNQELTFEVDKPLKHDITIKVYDDDGFSRDDCIGTITVPLYKLKDGKRKHYEKTIDMNWMGMVKGATLHFELEAQGWGCVE